MGKTHPVRFGIQTGQQYVAWGDMLALWEKADAWGYDSLWNFDHFYPIFTDPEGPCFEGWTTLAALAQATRRARIGHLVNGTRTGIRASPRRWRRRSITSAAAA